MTVRIEPGELYRLMSSPQGPVYNEITRLSTHVRDRAKLLCPVRKAERGGTLRGSISYEIRQEQGMPVGYIGTNVVYAMFVHEGTRPHRIAVKPRPKNEKPQYLRFMIGGSVFYRKSVNHPGTKGNPFLRNALKQVTGQS